MKRLTVIILLTCVGLLTSGFAADIFVIYWNMHHKLSSDRPNIYGQFALYEYDKLYAAEFDTINEARQFKNALLNAQISTGTLSSLTTWYYRKISTTEVQ